MLQKILRHTTKQLNIFFPSGIFVRQRHTVHAPCLTSRPRGAVPISLTSCPMVRRPGLHIEEEGMPCGIVLPYYVCDGGMNMLFRNVTIFTVPRLLRCPIEQRQIQQAVNNQPVVLRRIHGPPCRNKLAHRVISGNQLVGSLYGRFFSLLTSGQLISRHTGRRI